MRPSAHGGKDLDSAAQARRDSQARQQAQEAEIDRRREVEKQAREQLRPETRRCTDCWEYDEVTGGMCPLRKEKHRALCKAVGSGGLEKPMPAPLSVRSPLCRAESQSGVAVSVMR